MNGRTDIYTISGTPGKSARPITCDKHALQQGLGFRWPCQDLDLKAVSAGILVRGRAEGLRNPGPKPT